MIDTSNIKDHRGIVITVYKLVNCLLKSKKERTKERFFTYRDFSKFDHQLAVYYLSDLNSQAVYELKDVDEIEQKYKINLLYTCPICNKKSYEKKSTLENC